jgi:glycosyltransferase involved in cell wall biosynthesis
MIVRDEEQLLPICLASVKPYVDEIVIVDTGSSDRTKEIAVDLGAKVYTFEWANHFGDARNYALSKASGDWILVLDADERVETWQSEVITKLDGQPSIAGAFVKVRNYVEHGSSRFEADIGCRLMRNGLGIAYSGRIHEDISIQIAERLPNMRMVQTSVVIGHYGYIAERAEKRNKQARNRLLLDMSIAEGGDLSFLHYASGCEYFLYENYDAALHEFDQVNLNLLDLQSEALPSYASDLVYKKCYVLKQIGDVQQARDLAEVAVSRFPYAIDLLEMIGLLQIEAGEWEKALLLWNDVVNQTNRAALEDIDVVGHTNYARLCYLIGVTHLNLLNLDDAIKAFEACLLHDPSDIRSWAKWLDLSISEHSINETIREA